VRPFSEISTVPNCSIRKQIICTPVKATAG